MDRAVTHAASLSGTLSLPADKSIAHRAAILAAIADGTSVITNFPDAADPRSTLACLRQLGVRIVEEQPGKIAIVGQGRHALAAPASAVDCGNSGTTMRLLTGILAGRGLRATLVGDTSLSQRPMGRIAEPLRTMGASIGLRSGHAPVNIFPNQSLRGITYTLPVPSAQVKSCILLAGLYASGTTTVVEPVPSRDHTERMLGLPVVELDDLRHIVARPAHAVAPITMALPRDFSAAAFFLVAGSIAGGGPLRMPGVGLNPTRSALLAVLREMGADIRVSAQANVGGEPIGDLEVHPATLRGISIGGDVIPNLIDEVPVLAVAAACAKGRTSLTGAAELRVKECDRIHATVTNLRAFGVDIEEYDDGFAVQGGKPLVGARVDSFADHRIAMAMGIAGLVARGQTIITQSEVAKVSFPQFWDTLNSIAIRA